MNNISIILSLSLMLLFACKSSQTQQSNTNAIAEKQKPLSQQLLGRWQWVKTQCCGRLQTTTTPKSTQQNIFLAFNKTGVATKSTNGKTETISYTTGNTFNAEKDTMLQLSNTPRPAYLHFKADTLIIDYGYIDLQTEWYVRMKD